MANNQFIIDGVDTSDIPEITDFSNFRPNPFAEKIRKHGYSITIHYSPEDVAKMRENTLEKIKNLDALELSERELEAMERYKKNLEKQKEGKI